MIYLTKGLSIFCSGPRILSLKTELPTQEGTFSSVTHGLTLASETCAENYKHKRA